MTYIQKNDTACSASDMIEEYSTLALAKEVCSLNNDCTRVMDFDCNSDRYWTCTGTSQSSSENEKICTHEKEGKEGMSSFETQ